MSTYFPALGTASGWDKVMPCSPIHWRIGPDGKTKYIVQDFMQLLANFEPLTLSTPYNVGSVSRPSYYLVNESDPVDIGGAVGRWTRTYAPIFPDYETPEQAAVHFPAMASGGSVAARAAQTLVTHTTLRSKFFLCGVSTQDTHPHGRIVTQSDIPMFAPLPVITVSGWSDDYGDAINSTLNHPEFFPDNTARTTAAGQGDETGTTRTQAEYETMVLGLWQVVCEESTFRQQWPGSGLWERVTRYTRAQ